ERDGGIYHARGNVVVTFRDMRLEADEVTGNDENRIVTADGHVVFNRAEEHLTADHLSMNVDTKAGDFTSLAGEVGKGLFVKAETAHRTEEGIYQLKNSTVTSCCESTRPGWMLVTARAVVDPDHHM